MGIKVIGMMILKTAAQLMELGAWTAANNYTGSKMKERGNAVVREVEMGVRQGVTKLKVLKD
jgi:hypothetical protein